ncbi:hypothetical protein WR25_26343 isoform A [Diploscapter pachys]|uniref:Purple acid phosphatase n=4 Tax=Diploscapter pachys TaxID=2018661 RepID=A0A2A2JJH1_9BILA|nr:hypothetical protein WR25_26343 isoform A [Diploscapter pachys]
MWLKLIVLGLLGHHHVKAASPDQVHLAFVSSDTSQMGVIWNTYVDARQSVKYGTDQGNLNMNSVDQQIPWVYNGTTRYSHRAILNGLEPETTYYYQIEDRKFSFKTMSKNPSSYKVCIFGDLGYWHGNSTESIIRKGLNGEYDWILHLGDISYDLHTNNGQNGDDFLNQLEPIISRVPYMVIAGNHEDDGANFTNYQKRFLVPDNGFQDNQFYSFDLGPVHWVGVSTENYGFYYAYGQEPVFTQYNWLKNDLDKANKNRANVPWIFSFQHRPFYCSNVNSYECQSFENRLVRTGWLDMPGLESLFLQYGMDMGFWGHEHSYERFYPVADRKYWNGSDAYHNPKAPVYVLTGSAGCHSPDAEFTDQPWPWSAARNNDYGYSIVTVSSTSMRLVQISIDKNENTVDDFTITKDPGHVNSEELRRQTPGLKFPPLQCHPKDYRCSAKYLKIVNSEL